MQKDYSEILCKSIEIVSQSLLDGLQYDKTITCTIVDDSEAADGKYRVSDGSATFIAYSTEKYAKGASVYVTVPSGNYDNDKLIVGKTMLDDLAKSYTYVAPFDHYLQITNNLYASNTGGSLLANEKNNPKRVDGASDGGTAIKLGDSIHFDEGMEGFTVLGLRASFRSLLAEYNCVLGDYGLELKVMFETPDIGDENQADKKVNVQYLYLNTKDMIGNPYNFETYFTQEKLFKIEHMGAITDIEVRFKQSGTFTDANGNEVPYLEDIDVVGLEANPLFDNLFVDDIDISLGYDINSQEGEFIQLYTLNPMSYSPVTPESNQRKILMRWLHENADGKKYQIKPDKELSDLELENKEDYEIRWYRYHNGASAADGYCGINWEAFNNDPADDKQLGVCGRRHEAILNPDINKANEQIKTIILYGKAPGYYKYNVLPFSKGEEDDTADDADDFKATYFRSYYVYEVVIHEEGKDDVVHLLTPGEEVKDGAYRLVTRADMLEWTKEDASVKWDSLQYFYKVDEREVYRSSIITFTNEEDPVNEATLNALSALSFKFYDLVEVDAEGDYKHETYGNYLIYDEQNRISDAEFNTKRLAIWNLDLDDFSYDKVSKVEWIVANMDITANQTQAISPNSSMLQNIEIWNSNRASDDTDVSGRVEDKDFSLGLSFHLRRTLSASYGNNTIICKVTHNGIEYTAQKAVAFGQAGTMGSTATFLISHADNKFAMLVPQLATEDSDSNEGKLEGQTRSSGDQMDICKFRAELYDENKRLISIDDPNKYTVTWSWHTSPTVRSQQNIQDNIGFVDGKNTGPEIALQALASLQLNECYILKATLSGWKNENSNTEYDLVAYMPIALRASEEYTHITGETELVYLTDGSLDYYKNHYILHKADRSQLTTGWGGIRIENNTTSITRGIVCFYPTDESGKIINEDEHNLYGPELKYTKTNSGYTWRLYPAPVFFDGMKTAYAVQYIDANDNILWTQPILVTLSQYFSSSVNAWDGKTLQLNEDEGEILASRIGAGRKDSNNQFSGVLLGDWQGKVNANTETFKHTGLYGFRNGMMSFGFKDDGTAFIGSHTAGQLQFDGNTSTITSASYRDRSASGMFLDFDKPEIILRQYGTETIPASSSEQKIYEPYDSYANYEYWRSSALVKTAYGSIQYPQKINIELFKKASDGKFYPVVMLYDEQHPTYASKDDCKPNPALIDDNILVIAPSIVEDGDKDENGKIKLSVLLEKYQDGCIYKNNEVKEAWDQIEQWNVLYAHDFVDEPILYKNVIGEAQTEPVICTTEEQFNAALEKAPLVKGETSKFLLIINKQEDNPNEEDYLHITTWPTPEEMEKYKFNKEKDYFYYPSPNTQGKKTITRAVKLSAAPKGNEAPLSIGDHFRVNWDGSLLASKGTFTGIINATGGEIRGNLKIKGTLEGGTINGAEITTKYLNVDYGSIGGWSVGPNYKRPIGSQGYRVLDCISAGNMYLWSDGTIEGGAIEAASGSMKLYGYLKMYTAKDEKDPLSGTTIKEGTYAGDFGFIYTGATGAEDKGSYGIGMACYENETKSTLLSVVKATSANVGMSFGQKSYLSIGKDYIAMSAGSYLRLANTGEASLGNSKASVSFSSVAITDPYMIITAPEIDLSTQCLVVKCYGTDAPSGGGVDGQIYFQILGSGG